MEPASSVLMGKRTLVFLGQFLQNMVANSPLQLWDAPFFYLDFIMDCIIRLNDDITFLPLYTNSKLRRWAVFAGFHRIVQKISHSDNQICVRYAACFWEGCVDRHFDSLLLYFSAA